MPKARAEATLQQQARQPGGPAHTVRQVHGAIPGHKAPLPSAAESRPAAQGVSPRRCAGPASRDACDQVDAHGPTPDGKLPNQGAQHAAPRARPPDGEPSHRSLETIPAIEKRNASPSPRHRTPAPTAAAPDRPASPVRSPQQTSRPAAAWLSNPPLYDEATNRPASHHQGADRHMRRWKASALGCATRAASADREPAKTPAAGHSQHVSRQPAASAPSRLASQPQRSNDPSENRSDTFDLQAPRRGGRPITCSTSTTPGCQPDKPKRAALLASAGS